MKNCIFISGILLLCLSIHLYAATYGGGSGTSADPYLIYTAEQMNTIGINSVDWNQYFKLMADIDMSAYTGTQYNIIGNDTTKFTGTFDGNGHIISNLTYITTASTNNVGLFGYTGNSTIKNLGIKDVNLSTGGSFAGGLSGRNEGAIIVCCAMKGFISGNSHVGGLVGYNNISGTITSCYSTANVTGTGSYSYIGGLVGWNYSCTISFCYATGSVTATGSNSSAGSLVGNNTAGMINSCFWDILTSGQSSSAGGIGLPTVVMCNPETYLRSFWDFKGEVTNGTKDTWTMPTDGGYPILSWQVDSSSAPANDEIAGALSIDASISVTATSTNATGLDITANGYNDCIDVWYVFTPAAIGQYTVSVFNSSFDTTLGIFDTEGREIAYNDDFFGQKSVVILKASAGNPYYLRIAGHDGQTGTFTLSVTEGTVQAIQGDLNYDGNVNLDDLSLLAQNWLM